MGEVHARYYREHPDVEVVAVADTLVEKAYDFAGRWGIPKANVFSDYVEMFDQVRVDAVSVCTPHAVHAGPAIEALKRGIHVNVVKPMASTGSEAMEMYRAAKESGKVLMVCFHTRWSPELQLAKRIISSGSLGEIYYGEATLGGRRRGIPGWGGRRPSFITRDMAGGGVLLDLGCYVIDNFMYVLDHPKPVTVTAVTASAIGPQREAVVEGVWSWDPSLFEVEDFVAAFIKFDGRLAILLKESWAMHANTLGSSFLLGTKGGLKFSPFELYRDEFGYMSTSTFTLPQVDVYGEAMRAFIEAVKRGGPPPIDPREIVIEMFIMDAIYESAGKGKEVEVKIPSMLFN